MIRKALDKFMYVLDHCEIVEESMQTGEGSPVMVYRISTEGVVGTFCGRSFTGFSKSQAVSEVVRYFDNNVNSSVDSLVKDTLKKIGWVV